MGLPLDGGCDPLASGNALYDAVIRAEPETPVCCWVERFRLIPWTFWKLFRPPQEAPQLTRRDAVCKQLARRPTECYDVLSSRSRDHSRWRESEIAGTTKISKPYEHHFPALTLLRRRWRTLF